MKKHSAGNPKSKALNPKQYQNSNGPACVGTQTGEGVTVTLLERRLINA